MRFAERLSELMEVSKTTNYRLAKDLGVPHSLVGYWLNGERQPAMDNLVKLADHFDVSIDYLVGRTDNRQSER